MTKRAMMHQKVSRTAPSPAVGRSRDRRYRLALASVCAGTLLSFGLNAAAVAEDAPATPAVTSPGAVTPAPAVATPTVPKPAPAVTAPGAAKPAPAVAASGAAKPAPAVAAPGAAKPAPAVAAPGAAGLASVAVAPAPAACPAVPETQLSPNSKPGALRDRLRAGTDGARARLRELPVREMTQGALADLVLRQNLDLQSAKESIAIAQALVTQNDAAFDPTFFSSLSYSNSYFNDRHDSIGRLRDVDPNSTNPQETCIGSVNVAGSVLNPQIQGCPFQQPAVYSTQIEQASSATDSTPSVVGAVGASWNFILGGAVNDQPVPPAGTEPLPAAPSPTTPFALNGTLSASISSTWYRPLFFANAAPFNTRPGIEDGATYDIYGWGNTLFWTSSAALSLTMPVPFTKNAGYEGSPDFYSYQIARSGQRSAAWTSVSTRNATLAQALDAYWDLVQAVQTLRTLFDLRKGLIQRQASQKRLFDAGLATRYDLIQIDVQLASLDAQEESVWNQLLATSSHLGTLTTGDQRALLLPADGEALLRQPVTIARDGVYDRALQAHPDIKIAEESYAASKLTLDYSANQDLPDLSLSASYQVGQNNATFGYVNLAQSLIHLYKPDTTNLFIGLQYHLPIGMNATGAALDRARVAEHQAYDNTRLARQTVVNAVDQALGAARSAELVVGQSRDDLKLALCAYDRAREQRELGFVAEFEVLNKYQDLVSARLGLITAEVNLHKAQVNLLAAQGTLEQDYVR